MKNHFHVQSRTRTAKSLQSCPTLCDPIDSSPPGSPRPWDSPGKNTGVGCHFLLQGLEQRLANVFCKGQDSKIPQPVSHMTSTATTQLCPYNAKAATNE